MPDLTEAQLIVELGLDEALLPQRKMRAALIVRRQPDGSLVILKSRMGNRLETISRDRFCQLRREVLKFYLIELPPPPEPPSFKEERDLDEAVAPTEFIVSVEPDNRFE